MSLASDFRKMVTGDKDPSPSEALHAVGAIASAFGQMAGGQVQDLLKQVMGPWMLAVLNEAPRRWLPVLSSGAVCANEAGCTNAAVSTCILCGRPVCLAHCAVAKSAECACYDCLKAARPHVKKWSPPSVKTQPSGLNLEMAYDLIGVSSGVSDTDLKRAYRKACAEVHPDTAGSDSSSQARAAARFRQVQEAYELIQEARQ